MWRTDRKLASNGSSPWSPDRRSISICAYLVPMDNIGGSMYETYRCAMQRETSPDLKLASNGSSPWSPDRRSISSCAYLVPMDNIGGSMYETYRCAMQRETS